MNSKIILNDALNHKNTDRIPVDFGATPVSGMHVTCVAALREYYGLEKRPVKLSDPYQMLGVIEPDLMDAIGADVVGVSPKTNIFGFANENWKETSLFGGVSVLVPGDFNTTADEKGNTFMYPEGDLTVSPCAVMPEGGYFFDAIMRQQEIDEDKLNPEDNLEDFKPVTDSEIDYFKTELTKAAATGKGVVANFGGTALGDIALVPAPFLKHPKGIRDITEWYISTIDRQDYIKSIFEKQSDIAIKNLEKLNAAAGELVDAVFVCGTDFGTQISTFCSKDTFRNLYMPYYKKINGWIHKNTGWKTFKHSCGAIEPFIPLFIESGFDILNPVQCSAAGMDPEMLKETYGADITFWGGGIDTQQILPFGTPQQVREQVLRRCEIFSKNGGFVFNSIHNVQAKTPVENIVAMIDAVKEFNG
jgi:hypothetical protein